MTKENLDLGDYEEIDKAISKHIKENPDIDVLGEEEDEY
jgi:hypothetical protein